jgi:hypothetical protein
MATATRIITGSQAWTRIETGSHVFVLFMTLDSITTRAHTSGSATTPNQRVWEFPRKRISTQVSNRCPKSLPDDGLEEWVWRLPGPGRISTRFPTPCTRSSEDSGQTTKTKPGTLNSGSKPGTRIETGSHVLFLTLVSITMGAAQDRHNSPADPPHTKAYSIINPVPLVPQPSGSKQQGTGVLLF